MFNIFKYRRGQIRGVDFSLAMIIFLLTMSQILALTTTFINNSQTIQSSTLSQREVENFGTQVINTPGISNGAFDWSITPTSSLGTDWQFGLATNSSLDPYKLARLADNNDNDFSLDYTTIQSGLNFSKDFQLKFKAPINVTITTLTDNGNGLNISGVVAKDGSPLEAANIRVFMWADSNGQIDLGSANSSSTGSFFVSISSTAFAASDFFVVSAIAQYGFANQDLDWTIYAKTPSDVPTFNTQTLLNSRTTNGNSILVKSSQVGSDPNLVEYSAVFYSKSGSNFSQSTTNPSSNITHNTWDYQLPLPVSGMVGIFSHEIVGTTDYIAYSIFPAILDDEVQSSVKPATIPTRDATVVELVVNVRAILMLLEVTVWG